MARFEDKLRTPLHVSTNMLQLPPIAQTPIAAPQKYRQQEILLKYPTSMPLKANTREYKVEERYPQDLT